MSAGTVELIKLSEIQRTGQWRGQKMYWFIWRYRLLWLPDLIRCCPSLLQFHCVAFHTTSVRYCVKEDAGHQNVDGLAFHMYMCGSQTEQMTWDNFLYAGYTSCQDFLSGHPYLGLRAPSRVTEISGYYIQQSATASSVPWYICLFIEFIECIFWIDSLIISLHHDHRWCAPTSNDTIHQNSLPRLHHVMFVFA